MHEIVINTETTGLEPLDGHRVVEIGTVELINRSPTGKTFHRYLCPRRDIPADVVAAHALTAEFLADKPLFDHVADEFQRDMQIYLRRRLDTVANPLVYTFQGSHGPSIMTLSRALTE